MGMEGVLGTVVSFLGFSKYSNILPSMFTRPIPTNHGSGAKWRI